MTELIGRSVGRDPSLQTGNIKVEEETLAPGIAIDAVRVEHRENAHHTNGDGMVSSSAIDITHVPFNRRQLMKQLENAAHRAPIRNLSVEDEDTPREVFDSLFPKKTLTDTAFPGAESWLDEANSDPEPRRVQAVVLEDMEDHIHVASIQQALAVYRGLSPEQASGVIAGDIRHPSIKPMYDDLMRLKALAVDLLNDEFYTITNGAGARSDSPLVELSTEETRDYVWSGRLLSELEEEGYEPEVLEVAHANATMSLLSGELHAQVMVAWGVPGVTKVYDEDSRQVRVARLGSPAYENFSLRHSASKPTRSPIDAINQVNLSAWFAHQAAIEAGQAEVDTQPNYPYPDQLIKDVIIYRDLPWLGSKAMQ